ncbi:small ribosomal subunit protein eS10-like [Antedon mediterranea]|uniref:small ribosomal subunit protein eS10-like n=1 Tax=Antedon mediterranea TaxID=105859 RepID=UPI003AF696F2
MLMPKKNRVAIYEHLFKEGVMVAKKDYTLAKHPELDVPNLQVIKALGSLKSRGYVKEQFAWRHYYWYLSNEGIQYLRDFLHLPPEIVPSTLKRQARPEQSRPRPKSFDNRGPSSAEAGQRDSYRRGPAGGGPDKKGEAGAGASPAFEFKGGYGRGRPTQQ